MFVVMVFASTWLGESHKAYRSAIFEHYSFVFHYPFALLWAYYGGGRMLRECEHADPIAPFVSEKWLSRSVLSYLFYVYFWLVARWSMVFYTYKVLWANVFVVVLFVFLQPRMEQGGTRSLLIIPALLFAFWYSMFIIEVALIACVDFVISLFV